MSTVETFQNIGRLKRKVITFDDLGREIYNLPPKPKAYLEAVAELAKIITFGFAVRSGLINYESQNVFNQIDHQHGLVKLSCDAANNAIYTLNTAYGHLRLAETNHDKELAIQDDKLLTWRNFLSIVYDFFPHPRPIVTDAYIQANQDSYESNYRPAASDTLCKLSKMFSEPFNPRDIISDYNAACDDFDLYGIHPVTADVIWNMYCHQNGVVISRSPPSPNNSPVSPRCAAPGN